MSVFKPESKPGDMGIYDAFQWPDSVPKKPFNELTPEEKQHVLDAYRFSGYRPGTYQGPTFSGDGNSTPQ